MTTWIRKFAPWLCLLFFAVATASAGCAIDPLSNRYQTIQDGLSSANSGCGGSGAFT